MDNIYINFNEGGYCFISQSIRNIANCFQKQSDAIEYIMNNRASYKRFLSFNSTQRKNILEFMTGVKGLYIRNDAFFTRIFDIKNNKAFVEAFIEAIVGELLPVKLYNSHSRCASRISPLNSFVIADLDVITSMATRTHLVITKHSGNNLDSYSDATSILKYISHTEMSYTSDYPNVSFTESINIVIFDKTPAAFSGEEYMITDVIPEEGACPAINTICIFLDIFASKKNIETIESSLEAWLAFICFQDEASIVYLANHTRYLYFAYYSLLQLIKTPVELINIFYEMYKGPDVKSNHLYNLISELDAKEKLIQSQNNKIETLTNEIDRLYSIL